MSCLPCNALLQINMEVERGPDRTTILYIGPSMSFHVDLRPSVCVCTYKYIYVGVFKNHDHSIRTQKNRIPGIRTPWDPQKVHVGNLRVCLSFRERGWHRDECFHVSGEPRGSV